MHAYYALKSIGRAAPTSVLDIGTRNFAVARLFAKDGFQVHAIDPKPTEPFAASTRLTFEQTTLEAFENPQQYGVVVASYVSHLVTYDISQFLERLHALSQADGLIYVTLLGEQDGWAEHPWAKTMELSTAHDKIEETNLRVLYQSIEWFDGQLYDGTPKFWHIFKFVLTPAR